MKENILKGISIVSLLGMMSVPLAVFAVPSKPGGSSSSSVSYTGANTISSATTISDKSYESSVGGENALLVSGGTSTINNITVTKSGDESSESSDFYGTNAGVLVYNGATLYIKGGVINTNGSHANGVFAYGTGTIEISDATIKTSANNSGGVMVTGGGTLTANNLTVTTEGNSSASIRSDRGGGTLTVNGGEYTTNGVGSPAIYSTANITVNNATLTSTKSEGIVVEGSNSVTLKNTKVVDTNTTLNGNSETYKNIFLYQSMSGDADTGLARFEAYNSNFVTNKGDTFYVTNTVAQITLENNTFTNTSGDFLRIEGAKWGNTGSNGGDVTLEATDEVIEGDIIVDSLSTLELNLYNSTFKGAINQDKTGKSVDLSLRDNSTLILTGDTYVDSLTNSVSDNSNIYLNGYNFYISGNKIEGNNEEISTIENVVNEETQESKEEEKTETKSNTIYYVIGGVILFAFLIATLILKRNTMKKQ